MPANAPVTMDSAAPKRRPPWRYTFAKFGLSALAILIVAFYVDLSATWRQIVGQSPLTISLALAIIVLQVAAGGLRWRAILKGLGSPAPANQVLAYFYVSVFFNACLSGVLGGDVVRTWLANRAETRLKTVVSSVVLDHAAALAAVALLVLLTLPLFIARVGLATAALPAAIAAGGIAAIVLVAQLHRIPARLHQHWLARNVSDLGGATRAIFLRPSAALPVLGAAMMAQTALAAATYVMARGLDMSASLLDCLVLMQLVALVTALPISIGGWGVREVAMVGLFGLIGLPASAALALSVQLGVLSLLAALPGGLVLLLLRAGPMPRGEATAERVI
jgi:hypothetical protein